MFSPGFGRCDGRDSGPTGGRHTRDGHAETEGLSKPDGARLRVLQVAHLHLPPSVSTSSL